MLMVKCLKSFTVDMLTPNLALDWDTLIRDFVSNVGVRQGKNLWPILVSLFLNDLSEFISHAYSSLNDISGMSKILLSNDEIEVLFKLYILLYADDTAIFAESKEDLQAALNVMYLYCKSWDLEVNRTKT